MDSCVDNIIKKQTPKKHHRGLEGGAMLRMLDLIVSGSELISINPSATVMT